MVIILNNAHFSSSNIGRLNTLRVFRNLGDGATYDGSDHATRGATFAATVYIADGYTVDISKVVITMGGGTVTGVATLADTNTISISIPNVTGNILVTVPTTDV